ncbi:MAG: hypothetical protein DRI86_02275 [Bacteroidetes bacterium]|nr:MAG: hypothetical protein DRI86_02275 [Bacteroidota bacterium]
MSFGLFAQFVVQENFETNPLSVTSSSTGTGVWALNDRIQSQGLKSDSAVVTANHANFLTSNVFSTIGKYSVILQFDQICKIDMTDSAFVQYSIDSGTTFQNIDAVYYLGTSGYGTMGNKFSSISNADWLRDDTMLVTNTMWKTELFNISNIVGDKANVVIRFKLSDGGTWGQYGAIGPNNYPGWFIDSLSVTAMISELVPPTITMLAPIVQDTAFSTGPYNIGAHIYDMSGIDTALCIYNVMPENINDTLAMIIDPATADSFYCDIPFYGFGRTISYYIKAVDDSYSKNADSTATKSFFCKNSPGGTFVVGTGISESYLYGPIYRSSASSSFDYCKYSYLYSAAELSAAGIPPGAITKIEWYKINDGATVGNASLKIYLKNSNQSSLSTATAWTSVINGASNVLDNTAQSIPSTIGWIPFDINSFNYYGQGLEISTDWDISAVSGNPVTGAFSWQYEDLLPNDMTIGNASGSAVSILNTGSYGGAKRPNIRITVMLPSAINNDIGVAEILSPASSVTANIDFYADVLVRNYGVDTITSLDIEWTLDGVLQSVTNWTGSLLPDSTFSIVLDTLNLSSGGHNIKSWTDNPNNGSDNDLSNDTSSFDFYACSGPLAGTYTIGGVGADFPSFYDVSLALNQCGISGAVTFNAAAGTYNEHFQLYSVDGASATNTITFQSASGDSSDVILAFDATGTVDNYVVKLNGTSYVNFKNMTFEAQDANYARVFVLSDTIHDFALNNNIIKTTIVDTLYDSRMSLVIALDSTIGNNINITNNALTNGSYAILLIGDTTVGSSSNWIVNNNTVVGHSTIGVQIVNGVSVEINGNTIEANIASVASDYEGIYLAGCKTTANVTKNKVITYMTKYSYGIHFTSCEFDSLIPANIVNNFVQLYGDATGLSLSACIIVQETKNVNIYFNNVRHSGDMSNSCAILLYASTSGSVKDINIVNNILANDANGYIYYTSNTDTSMFVNHHNNLYNYNGSGIFAKMGSNINSYSDWITATNATDCDTIIPYYFSATDLHIANNLLNGRGISITGITDDIDGDVRNATNPDFGADEFDPSPYDVTTLGVLSPFGACGLTSSEVVMVRIKNIGSDTINGGLTANYRIMGSANVVTESISTIILPGDTLDYAFTATADLDVSAYGADSLFEFKVWGSLTGDNVPHNDTSYLNVHSGFVPGLPTVTGDTVSYGQIATISAVGNAIYFWEDDTISTYLKSGSPYTTLPMYDTTTFYVSDRAGSGMHTAQCGNGTATVNNAPNYGLYNYSWSRILYEASEIGGFTGDIDSISFFVNNSPSNYIMPDQRVYLSMVDYSSITDLSYVDNSTLTQVFDGTVNYNGSGMYTIAFSTPFAYDGVSNLVVQWENYDGSWSSGYPTYEATNMPGKTVYRAQDASFPTTAGYAVTNRPNIMIHINALGCYGNRVPVTVIVEDIPMDDIGVSLINSPNTGIDLSSTEDVTIMVNNYAVATQDTIPVAYQLDAMPIVRDTIYQSLVFGDSTIFTFSQQVDLSAYQTYNLKVYAELANDTIHFNDTTSVQITNNEYVFCASGATSTADSKIDEVVIAGLSNNTSAEGCADYSDFSSMTATLLQGGTYSISVTLGTCGGSYNKGAKAWIDYNRDGVFSTDEEIANFGQASATTTYTESFTVPFVTSFDVIKMRVVGREGPGTDNASVTPCGTYSWGETEDYSILIFPRIPHDAGITEILEPNSTENEATVVPVKAVVKNFGLDTITSMSIDYTINGGVPTTMAYNSILAPLDIDTLVLDSLTVPAGNYSLCIYPVLAGDSVQMNDTSCIDLFGTPIKDAYMLSVAEIQSYCGMQYDTVRVKLTNIGVDTINGSNQTVPTTISYNKNNGTAITESFTTVVAPGDTAEYTFATLVYVGTNNLVDSVYNIKSWISFNNDNVLYNDTASTVVDVLHIPFVPTVVTPVSTPFGTQATLTASSVDSLYWYKNDTTTAVLGEGVNYLTPYLYASDSFSVNAMAGSAGGSPIIGSESNTTKPLPMNMFYEYTYSQSIFLDSEFNSEFGKIIAVSYYYNGYDAFSGDDIKIFIGTTTKTSFSSTSDWVQYNDLTEVYSGTIGGPAIPGWITLYLDAPFVYDGGDNLVIAFDENTPGYEGSQYDFYSSQVSSDRSIYFYSDSQDPDPTNPPTTGYSLGVTDYIPNIKLTMMPSGCNSARALVEVNVGAQSTDDVGVISLVAPVDGIFKTASDPVTIKVKNFGTSSQSNIPVSYVVDGGIVNNGTVPGPIASGDSATYTFTQSADFSIMGNIYNIVAYTALTGDATALNDTINIDITNEFPVYCISKATNATYSDLTNVSVGSVFSNSSAPTGNKYTNFMQTVAPAFIQIGVPSMVSITSAIPPGYSYSQTGFDKIYIDYNRDGDFDDANEEVFVNAALMNGTIVGSFNVPAGVVPGITAMRVVHALGYSISAPANVTPCGTYDYGETEDYLINIAERIPKDLGVEAILNPTTISNTQTPNLIVRVRNFGTDTISAFDIKYTINNGVVNTYTYSLTSINPLDSVDVNVGIVNLAQGTSTIKAYTELADDSVNVNDTSVTTSFITAYATLSYLDDFEGANLWFNDTIVNQWELGVPTASNIDTAHSPVNVWAINLDGNYNNGSEDKLYTPLFIIPTNVDSAYIKFWNYIDCEPEDGGYLQFKNGKNGNWLPAGTIGDGYGINWVDTAIGGTHMWSSVNSGWFLSEYKMNFGEISNSFNGVVAGDTLSFRFIFYSTASGNSKDGWAIDDFSIELPTIPNDVGVVAITSPDVNTQVGSTVTATIEVKNYGTVIQTSIPVSYSIDGGTPITATFTPSGSGLAPNSTQQFTFNTTFTAPGSTFNFCAKTELPGDLYAQNNEMCASIIPTPANTDVGIVSVEVNPFVLGVNGVDTTRQTYNTQCTVKIVNFGMDTQTSIPLDYSKNNIPVASETWTGSLAQGDTTTFTFTATYHSPIGNYQLCAKTNLSGDADNSNDEGCHSYIGLYDVGIDGSSGLLFTVNQNEPNPAFGKVSIDYVLPKAGKVHFELRNALGQVITSTEETHNAGNNSMVVDASILSNGVYYYTFEFDGKRITHKMVVGK